MIHPAALALIAVVALAAYGVWIIKSATSGISEGFAMNSEILKCESRRSACLKEGTKQSICDEESVTCLSKIKRNVSTATPAPSVGAGSSGTSAAGSTPTAKICKDNLLACLKTKTESVCSSEFTICSDQVDSTTDKKALSEYYELRRVVDAGLSYSEANLSPDFKDLLLRVKENIPLQYTKPTAANLAAAQGENEDIPKNATYTPSQQRISPHQTPSTQQPTLTSTTPSDAGTQAEQIQSDSVLTPSLRQQIRDDVKGAVNSVLADINNQYEVKYVYQ